MARIDDLKYLIGWLLDERGESAQASAVFSRAHNDEAELFAVFRALVNTRMPQSASPAFLEVQDRMLRGMIEDAGIVDASALPESEPGISLWRGDITTIKADAVVNAANDKMLGCWVPGHHCIDNAIHTFAGVQLREKCAQIMRAQGCDEPTGSAKITPGYNLPSRYVLHTVGPIAAGRPTAMHREQLASSYRSCLDLALGYGLETVTFCCISTGVFGFPQREAAPLAIDTVRTWLAEHRDAGIKVVFNVFSKADEDAYRDLLGGNVR